MVRIKVSKRAPDRRYAFLPGELLELNTMFDDVDAIEMRVGEVYGAGDYRATLIAPKNCDLPPFTFAFSVMDPNPGREKQPLSSPSSDPRIEREEDSPLKLSDLLQVVKVTGSGKEGTGEASGVDYNAAFFNLATRLIESTVADQARRIDKLTTAVENLVQTKAERELAPPPPAQDQSRAMEVLSNAFRSVVEVAVPRAQVPASPPPPPAQSGPSDFEKTLALADRFAKLSEVKAPSVPPQPANYGDSLVAEVLKVVTGQLGKLGHEPQIKQPTLKDQVESLARIATLMRQTGLTADAVGQIGEAIDDDQVEEEPGPVRSFLLGLAPILNEVARGFGSGFGAEINKSLAPAIAGAVFPSKPNNPQTPATPTQPLPQKGGDVKGPTPVPPPSAPKHIRPFPMPPSAASPAPFQPRQTVKARPGVDQESATKTGANPSASHPGNPEGRPADLLNANRQPLGVHPGGAQITVLSDEMFGHFLSVLQMDMPPEEAGRILLSQTPEGAGQFFRLPVDQAWKVAERYLTPPQKQAAEKMLPRITEVFHAMQALMGVTNPGN